jgi:hypothetical protein
MLRQLYLIVSPDGIVRLFGVQCGVAGQSRGMISAVPGSGGYGDADDLVPGGEAGSHLVSVLDRGESVTARPEVR